MSHILGMHANTTGMARQRIAIRSSGRPARHVRSQKAAVYASSRISPCHGATQAQHGHPAVAILQSQPVLQPRRRRTSCAASGTISDTAAAVQHPPLQVTRSNFAASLPAIKQALQQCQFFSFDCEMTGLYLPNQDDHAADDVDDRYVKAAAAAEQFLVAQFGLSFFEWTGSSYEVRSFNFYLFPSTNGDIDVRFMSQVSALAFLASEGFDFNRVRLLMFLSSPAAATAAVVHSAQLAVLLLHQSLFVRTMFAAIIPNGITSHRCANYHQNVAIAYDMGTNCGF